jgi:cell division protein FtsN
MAKSPDKTPSPGKVNDRRRMGWMLLVFFTGAFMFTLGILVGRGTAPVHFDIAQIEKELAGLRAAVARSNQPEPNVYRQTVPPEQGLGFYEKLKSSSGTTVEPRSEDAFAAAARERAEQEARAAAASPAPVKPPPAASPPAAAPPPAAGRYSIQVAALKDAGAADSMVARLKRQGFAAYRVGDPKGQWYRVRVGDFQERQGAVQVLARLNQIKIKGFIVQP